LIEGSSNSEKMMTNEKSRVPSYARYELLCKCQLILARKPWPKPGNKFPQLDSIARVAKKKGRQALEPFTSDERNSVSADLSLSWNVLDFRLSHIRAKQAAHDVLIADEERRRVADRIMQNVRKPS
jgi:hypothetical protein